MGTKVQSQQVMNQEEKTASMQVEPVRQAKSTSISREYVRPGKYWAFVGSSSGVSGSFLSTTFFARIPNVGAERASHGIHATA